MRVAAILAAAALLFACSDQGEVRGQWLVTVATDAPVPQLGDRLLVELLDDAGNVACSACRRVLGAPLSAWPLSFGVVPGAGVSRIRVELYRGSLAADLDGLPSSDALIELVGRLPEVHGQTPVGILLRTECFGQPSDVIARTTCDPDSATVGPEPLLGVREAAPLPGSSPLAERQACSGVPAEGMACVPGGLFILGSPETDVPIPSSIATPEHLVRVSRFAVDTDEVTVGAVRALIDAGLVSGHPAEKNPIPRSADAACTYLGPNDQSHDAWPVNCVSKGFAEEVCTALGKRLPTEAEWEWAAGNLELESRYPWGDSEDVCARAVVGRGREPILELNDTEVPSEVGICRDILESGVLDWGPVPGGSPNDVTLAADAPLDTTTISNFGGNIAEFVVDDFAGYDAPCWNTGSILFDPVCEIPRSLNASTRGGNWADLKARARITIRNPTSPSGDYVTGFRCAASLE